MRSLGVRDIVMRIAVLEAAAMIVLTVRRQLEGPPMNGAPRSHAISRAAWSNKKRIW
jgi:hypothetical protein